MSEISCIKASQFLKKTHAHFLVKVIIIIIIIIGIAVPDKHYLRKTRHETCNKYNDLAI
jgi:uncharacterized membrane protein YwzB